MPKLSAEAKLFGIDVQQIWLEVQLTLRQLGEALHLERYLPQSFARTQLPDARSAWLRGERWLSDHTEDASHLANHQVSSKPATSVLLLGEDAVLIRQLSFPKMPVQSLESALALEVQASSPFNEGETVWAYRQTREKTGVISTRQSVTLVLTSRSLVRAAQVQADINDMAQVEVWAQVPAEAPILMRGFGEQARLRKESRQNWWLALGGFVVAGLLAVLAISPTLQLRAKALDAHAQLLILAGRTQEQTVQRQQLMEIAAQLEAFENAHAQQVNPILVLKRLTESLPDGVAIQSLQLKGHSLTLQGVADDASVAVQRLGAEPGFHEVRFPSAVTRIPNVAKENFVLSAEVDPEVFGYRAKQVDVNEQPKKAE